jgi:hypothetical protein
VQTTEPRHHSPGALLVCAEWAIAHGDADGLAHAARELGDRVGGRVGERLRALSRLCLADYDEAAQRWPALKDDVRAELASHN